MAKKSLNLQEKKVIAMYSSAVAQTLSANASTNVDFATAIEDNYGAVSVKNGGTPWGFKVPKAGVYDITANVATVAHTLVSAKKYELSVYVNGVKTAIINKFQSQSATALFEVVLKGCSTLRLKKNDVVTFAVFTDSAVTVDLSTDALYNNVSIVKRETKIEEN